MEEISFHDEVPKEEPRKVFFTEKRWLLFVYVPIFVIVCVTLGILVDERKDLSRLADIVLTLGLNIFSFAWCRIDSRERGYELHRFFSFGVVIFGTLALLYYLFRSRGFRGGLTATGWLILYTIVLFLAAMIASAGIVLVLVLAGAVSPNIFDE